MPLSTIALTFLLLVQAHLVAAPIADEPGRMFGLTVLGFVHTLLAVGALGCAAFALATRGILDHRSLSGQNFSFLTAGAALLALRIHERSEFGPGHVLAWLALAAVVIAHVALGTSVFGRASQAVEVTMMTAMLLFHAIPGATEILTRLPPDAPIVSSLDSPLLRGVFGLCLVLWAALTYSQLKRVRSNESERVGG